MPKYTWRNALLELPDYPIYAPEALLEVQINGGSVELQRRNAENTEWVAFETFGTDTVEPIAVGGATDWRIVALGDALFKWSDFA